MAEAPAQGTGLVETDSPFKTWMARYLAKWWARGEVGGVVLTQKWLAVDGYQWLDCVGAEVGVAGELAALPGVGFAACIGITVKIDVVHGVFH